MLPGLGAFTLRPTGDGESSPASTSGLSSFLSDIIDHVAAQGTSAERARYWSGVAYDEPRGKRMDHVQELTKPAADTAVLLGYVTGEAHMAWILERGLYNMRADPGRVGAVGIDGPELSTDFVVLYDAVGDDVVLLRTTGSVTVRTGQELARDGYPQPHGSRYLCVSTAYVGSLEAPAGDRARQLARIGRPRDQWAKPTVVSWAELSG